MIYMIQAKHGQPVMIGYARNDRAASGILLTVNSATWEEYKIIRRLAGGFNDAYKIQEKFAANIIKNNWFKYDPEMATLTLAEKLKKKKKAKWTEMRVGETEEFLYSKYAWMLNVMIAPFWKYDLVKEDGLQKIILTKLADYPVVVRPSMLPKK